MDRAADITARTQRFNEAVRTFTLSPPARHAKLTPFKDGIVELRQKGASLRLIRELLATVNVAVGTDSIARFLAEMNGYSMPQRPAKRTLGARLPRDRLAINPPSPLRRPWPHRNHQHPEILPRTQRNPTHQRSVPACVALALRILATSDHSPCS